MCSMILILEGLILDYSEVEFMLAEAKERGFYVPGTAAEHYNAGITASMEYWGIDACRYHCLFGKPCMLLMQLPQDTWKQKIGTQQWIAFFNRGFEGWSVWRRLDFTGLNVPPGLTYSDIPNRLSSLLKKPR